MGGVTRRGFLQAIAGVALGGAIVRRDAVAIETGPSCASASELAADWSYEVSRCAWALRNGNIITFHDLDRPPQILDEGRVLILSGGVGYVFDAPDGVCRVTDEQLEDVPALARRLRRPRPSPPSSPRRSRAAPSPSTPG